MKHSRVVMVVAVFLITTGLSLMLMLSPFSRLDWKSLASTFSSPQSANLPNTRIVQENALLGTKKWRYNLDKGTSVFIQAYADTVSLLPGQKLTFFVSTHDEGTRYTVSLYRLGWYGGDGARLMLYTSFFPGHEQGYYDSSQHALINCHSCLVNMTTGLVEANWRSSYVLKIPSDWVTGVYLAKFTDEHNYTAVVPFDVRGDTHARYVVVTPDTSYQAYNSWGGFSLFTSMANSVQHGVQVSFNRPYLSGQDTSQLFDSELDAIRWLEMQGYDLSYVSAVDLHEHPRLLLDHRAYISLGQDTFWTKEMRDGVEYARDHGVGLAFLGAETGTWQMRFEPDHRKDVDRTIVSYRVSSASHNLQFDPFYGKDASRVTAQWRDPFLARPENALLGVMFSGFTLRPTNFVWRVNSRVTSPLLSSTGLAFDKEYGCALVGNVWDRVFENGSTPSGLSLLATSKTINASNQPDVSNSTSYIAPSGALVFASGSLYWNRGLDSYRFHQDPQCPLQESAVPEIQRLMANVMNALIVSHKPAQVTQKGQMFPLITTPYAIDVPDGSSQGSLVRVRAGSVAARQSTSQAQKMSTSHVSSFPGIRSAPGNSIGGKTQSSYPHSLHSSLGSFRAGRQGRHIHTVVNSFRSTQSKSYQSTHVYSSPAEIRSEERRLRLIQHSSYWRSVLARFFGTLRRHH